MLKFAFSLLLLASMDLTTGCYLRRLSRPNSEKTPVCVLVDNELIKKIPQGKKEASLEISAMRYEKNGCKPFPNYLKKPVYKEFWPVVLWGKCKIQKLLNNANYFQGVIVVANIPEYPPWVYDINGSLILLDLISYTYVIKGTNKERPIKLQLLPFHTHYPIGVGILFFPLLAFLSYLAGMWLSFYTLGPSTIVEPQIESSEKIDSYFHRCLRSPTLHFCVVFLLALLVIILSVTVNGFALFIIFIICVFFTEAFRSLIMDGVIRCSSTPVNERFTRRFLDFFDYDIRGLILIPLCIIPGTLWIVFRTARHLWILQDICGIVACIYTIKTVRMGRLKAFVEYTFIFAILGLAWFITFFLMIMRRTSGVFKADGVDVYNLTTAESRSDSGYYSRYLPLELLMPDVNFDGSRSPEHNFDTYKCGLPGTAKLSFFYIIFPGFLVVYSFWCDFKLLGPDRRMPWLYCCSTLGHATFGMFLGLLLGYLYPTLNHLFLTIFTIIGPLLSLLTIALIRKEARIVWYGFFVSKTTEEVELFIKPKITSPNEKKNEE